MIIFFKWLVLIFKYIINKKKNIEYFGNDLQTITVASLSDCCLLCIQNAQCQAYTFTIVTTATTGNLCKLKFAIGSNFRCVANSMYLGYIYNFSLLYKFIHNLGYSGTRPQLVPTVTIPTAPTVTINPFTTTTTPIRQSFCVDNPNAAFNIVNYVVLNTVRVPSVSACCNVCGN